MTHETPVRFFHKGTGKRLVAVKSHEHTCGDGEFEECALFNRDCYSLCFDVEDVVGYDVYFNEIPEEKVSQ